MQLIYSSGHIFNKLKRYNLCKRSRNIEIGNLAFMLLYCSSQFLLSNFKFQAVNGYQLINNTWQKAGFFMKGNSLKKIRESLMMSKAELAREAKVSPITIARIEKNMPCRMETKRKILLALGFKLSDKNKIFGD